jgi:hemerythrin-like domain-containing protein
MLPAPAPGFDQPLALLRACHERIQRQCATLEKLVAHLRSDGLTPAARQAAADVHRYFSTAGRHHHEDEEQDLFPRLRGQPDLAELLAALAHDHRRMEMLWQELAPRLKAPDTIRDFDAFGNLVGEFTALYAAHIRRENSELLPRAEQLLPDDTQREIAARMAARRGVTL